MPGDEKTSQRSTNGSGEGNWSPKLEKLWHGSDWVCLEQPREKTWSPQGETRTSKYKNFLLDTVDQKLNGYLVGEN